LVPAFPIRLFVQCLISSRCYFLAFQDKTVIEVNKDRDLKNFYELCEIIGSGGFATVHLASCRTTGKIVAVKIIQKKTLFKQVILMLRQEIKILRKLDHPNVIKFIDYFEDDKTCNIVTEYAGGGELFKRLMDKVCYDESEARTLAEEILNAIKYCHDRNIMHR
jgi:calcium/calmodulin-dependent protein kinase I